MRTLLGVGGLLLIGALMLGAVACSSGTTPDPTPVATFKITPASGTRPAASPTTAATAAATSAATSAATAAATGAATSAATAAATTAAGTPAAGGTTITITASNIVFDKSTLTASAGSVTVELDNKDGGIPHNIHFYKGSDASGADAGSTAITSGPATEKVTLTFEKGEYYFQCDVHPATMSGKLTVS